MSSTPDNLPPVDAEELSDERLPLTELESVSLRPPSWRKRGAQLALLALALCVGLMATWSVIVPGKRQAAQPKLTPMPAELVSNLTNATITLNGKKLAGHPPMVVSAHLESDEITVSAPLFRPYTCRFKVLTIDGGDATHCLWTTANGLTQAGAPFLIGVYLTPDDLLPGQKAQIVTSLMQRLSLGQQTTTLPGDAIATAYSAIHSTIISQPATTTLQARATLAQAEPQSPISRGSYPFSPFCEQLICPFGFGPAAYQPAPTGQVWGLVLNAALHWRFTDETGATVADVTYPPDPLAGFCSLRSRPRLSMMPPAGISQQPLAPTTTCQPSSAILAARF